VVMFIRYYLDLSLPFEEVEEGLLADPEVWLPGVARQAEDRGEQLLGEVGFSFDDDHRLSKEVHIVLGPPYRTPGMTLLPLSWKATGPERLFPSLDADLEIASGTEPDATLDQRPVPAPARSRGQGTRSGPAAPGSRSDGQGLPGPSW
jgi:hypothetical protein